MDPKIGFKIIVCALIFAGSFISFYWARRILKVGKVIVRPSMLIEREKNPILFGMAVVGYIFIGILTLIFGFWMLFLL